MTRQIVFSLMILASACGDATIGNTSPDAPLAIIYDARITPDVIIDTACNLPAAPPCPDGTVCLNGKCQASACLTPAGDAGSACPEGTACSVACVPLTDPCQGITCGNNETCVSGQCIPGCFSPSPCVDKVCGANQFCSGGNCVDIHACAADCADGTACNIFCRPLGPCEGVQCDEGQFCTVVGATPTCVTNLCFDKTCAPTFICSNGDCVPTCGCDPACKTFETCINNVCVCTPSCEGKACGDSDGCDGKCNSQTCGTGMVCTNGTCVCQPSCTGKSCGDSDGCTGGCNGPCDQGTHPNTTCQNKVCVCAHATCQTACCATGEVCKNGTGACCQPDCTGKLCGADDGCGNKCNGSCVGTGADPDDVCRNGECVCPNTTCMGDCCKPGDVCSTIPGPDLGLCCTRNCAGKVCGDSDGCGGKCSGSCAASDPDDTCQNGMCVCPTNNKVCMGDCCKAGEVCSTVPGPSLDTCCKPTCTGKKCGDADGCGGICSGPCDDPLKQCNGSKQCVCKNDPCGNGTCCTAGAVCNAGTCCQPTCNNTDPQCGPNEITCGQQCNGCPSNESCQNGTCACVADSCNGACCPGSAPNCTTDGCCPNGPRTCADGNKCCANGETCFLNTSNADVCCVASRWCTDSKTCCPSDKPICFNGNDTKTDNDVCCGNNEFLCGGACCANGHTCTTDGLCVLDCVPPCGCHQDCVNGQCVDNCPAPGEPCGCTGCCTGGGTVCNQQTGRCQVQ